MPYWLESDSFADDPRWEVLAKGRPDLVDRLQSTHSRLMSKAAHLLTNGYLTDGTALQYARGRRQVLDLLATAVLDLPPMLHRRGDDCECFRGEPWVDGYGWRLHGFLKKNPARSEYNRNQAQKADRRNAALKALVRARDGGTCRYCRSGPLDPNAGRAKDRRRLLQYDHTDPDAAAGPNGEGYVVSCARCNEHKGHRTPDEADMVLLPPPSPELAAAWIAAWEEHGKDAMTLYDLGEHPDTQPQSHRQDRVPIDDRIGNGSPSDRQHDPDRDRDPVTDPDRHREPPPIDEPTPPMHPNQVDDDAHRAPTGGGEGAGSGRGGPRDRSGPPGGPQPVRTSADPDIYHRRSRAPTMPLPQYQWPDGAQPRARPPASPSADEDEHQREGDP